MTYFVVPPIGARPDLHAPNEFVRTAQEVPTQFRQPLGRRVV